MKNDSRKLLASLFVSASLSSTMLMAGGVKGSDSTSYSPHKTVRTSLMLRNEHNEADSTKNNLLNKGFKYIGLGTKNEKGLFGDNLEVSGVVRFVAIQRNMKDSYVDMTTGDKSISFTDYPSANANSGANGGFPLLELNLKSKVKKNFNFNVGYSLGHNLTGDVTGGSRNIGAVQNLNFGAQLKTGKFKTSIWAGEVLWTNLSRFTMGQPEFTDNYFERLPWDWYRTSFTRYQEYFTLSSNIGARNLGRSPLQGGVGVVEYLPFQTSLKVIYGQTNRSILASDQGTGYPSITQGYRLEKYVFERALRGKVGLNLYSKNSYISNTSDVKDDNLMYTFDFDVKVKKIKFEGEIGASKVNTFDPISSSELKGNGFGAVFKTSFDRRAVLWPFSIEFYNINKNFGNVDGAILNQNPYIKQGGAKNEFVYNDSYFANIANEVGQVTNNRRGVNLDFEASLGDFKVQLGYSASQEIEKLTDTLTIQHRVNGFSRSRFRPWFQAAGPTGRIKSFWYRTFETVTLTNPDSEYLNRKNLGFNAVELTLKYRKKIGKKHELILLNLTTANTISESFSALAFPGGKGVLVSVLYNDFTAAFKLSKRITLVGNFAVESTEGSTSTAVKDPLDNKVKFISQIGHMYALGIDYDVSKKTSFHLRSKYMDHEDKNFTADKFSGFETTFELKIFL